MGHAAKVRRAYIQWQKENYPTCPLCENEQRKKVPAPFAIEYQGKYYHYCKAHHSFIIKLLKSVDHGKKVQT